MLTNWVTEAGTLELIMLASAKGPKQVSKKLAMVTGYQALPPFHSLGFHYSKWE